MMANDRKCGKEIQQTPNLEVKQIVKTLCREA